MDSRTQEICWLLIRNARELLEFCRDNGVETPKNADDMDMVEQLEKSCQDMTRKL
jgi:hypothetical protein